MTKLSFLGFPRNFSKTSTDPSAVMRAPVCSKYFRLASPVSVFFAAFASP
jgi:hypothetical protein